MNFITEQTDTNHTAITPCRSCPDTIGMYITEVLNMYCPNCGAQINDGMNYCPYCGSALQTAVIPAVNASSAEYQLVLVSAGTCDRTTLKNLLEDVFGYTAVQSSSLLSAIPVQIAQNLNEEEASVIAQMFYEYGADVTVLDEQQTYVDLSRNTTGSLFNADGSLIAKAAAVIAAVGLVNHVTSYRTIRKPSLLERIFRPLIARNKPKRYIPLRRKEIPRMAGPKPIYRNTMERQKKPVTGHRGGPNGRMKSPGRPGH